MDQKNFTHVRLDKWLWAVRIYKTRTIAANACKKGRVTVNGTAAKPSYTVKLDDSIEVKVPPIVRTFIVTGLLEKRVGAKIAVNYVQETTPQEEFEKLRAVKSGVFMYREKGTGRPTKKERREIDRLLDAPGDQEPF
jgi:ribosome-associated heat shock protein Hsp15